MIQRHVIRAVCKRDFTGYFRSPTGYVFITLFILLAGFAAFWPERFFANNLANFDTLNAVFPYLLIFFIPAVTMAAWASERQQGTDELLLTLPARDGEFVVGKYLACVGVYLTALAFALTLVGVLGWLGDPDPGLVAATFAAYAILGATLIGVGMIGSLLTSNLTVGFVLGAVGCAGVLFLEHLGAWLPASGARMLKEVAPTMLFREVARGVMSPGPIGLCVGLVATTLYVNQVLLGRRLWEASSTAARRVHGWLRGVSLGVLVIGLTAWGQRSGIQWDMTAERLYSLSPQTAEMLRGLSVDRPVSLQAFISPHVPQEYVGARSTLWGLLRAYEASAPGRLWLHVREPEPFSAEAREAREQFGILPQSVVSSKGGRAVTEDVYLGVAVTCGAEEVIIPFFHKGMAMEYELTRAIRVASQSRRRKVGVLATDAKLFGGMDFASMSSAKKWSILEELSQQYEVVQVSPDADYPTDLNVLLVAMASSLTQPQLDRLSSAMGRGLPALVFDDPLPLVNFALAPGEPKGGQGNILGGQQQPPKESKGDIQAFYRKLGLRWPAGSVVWDSYNPHPPLAHLAPEVVFVGAKSGAAEPFHAADPVSAGLQEVVLLFPGHVEWAGSPGLEAVPLMTTTTKSGVIPIQDTIQRGFFGILGLNPQRTHRADHRTRLLAVRVKAKPATEAKQASQATQGMSRKKKFNHSELRTPNSALHCVVVADLDMISEEFFDIRRQGIENLEFDNIAFVANAVDVLAGDEGVVGLRKRRRRHRTLETVEALVRRHAERSQQETQAAEDQAKRQLQEAQASLERKANALRARTDLDEQAKSVMVASLEEVENRRFAVTKANIEDEKRRAIEESQARMEEQVRAIQNRIKLYAVILPPLPTVVLGVWVYWRKRRRERELVPPDRAL